MSDHNGNKPAATVSVGGKTTEAINVVRDEALTLRSYRLVVVEGAERGAQIGLDIDTPTRVLIGQSSACHLVLTDRQVSRRHVAVDLFGGLGLKVVDLGSTNGTRVNGVRVIEAIALPGDRISLGGTTLRVDLAATAADEVSVAQDTATPATPAVTTSVTTASFSPNVSFGRLIGASIAMRRLHALCERLAASDLPVTIEGETGVGKELLAEALHEAGPRKAKPFIVFDCAGVRGDAVLALLFGDPHPNFPSSGPAAIHQAHGGTLLLDEVTELGDDAQARLIRFLDAQVQPGGENKKEPDVRVLATSRRDLDQAVQAGRFRDELFYRLAVSRIELPPLREREGDVELLARSLWKTMSGARGRAAAGEAARANENARDPRPAFPPAMLVQYEQYRWPGNVRELKNVIARRIALGAFADTGAALSSLSSTGSGVVAAATPSSSSSNNNDDAIAHVLRMDLPLVEARAKVVTEFETRYLAKVLEQHGGNVSRAAAASGIARRYFQLLRARLKSTPE